MLAITLNPGFVPILAALAVLAAPRMLRAPTIAGAALLALWLLLDREFGAAARVAQMGLPVVLLNLDALNRIFGIALLLALIIIAVFSSSRRNRYEDAAILSLAGGTVSALFVGDLISFVAAAAFAGLAAAWTVFASPLPGANRAGVRLLIWHGIEGLLFLVGVAFQLRAGAESSVFARLDVDTLGGGFIFAALMIRVGAPLAHVWLKDVVAHASPAGGAALSVFSSMLGVYALARFFPSETLLAPIGAAMIVIGVVFAAAKDDLRAGAAYGLMAQTGVCVALIGAGSPLAMAAAEGHAFTSIFAFLALLMALGAILERTGNARISSMTGLARTMPLSVGLLLVSGLAVSATPGLAVYATHTVALDATAQWPLRWLWLMIAATPAVLFVALVLRPVLTANLQTVAAKPKAHPIAEAPFTMLLGAALASFFCISIGLAPGWLYGLMPADLAFQPYALDRVAPRLETLGAAGVAFVLLRATGVAAKERAVSLLDIDALYRGPLASAGRWAGVVMLRFYGAWQAALSAASNWAARAFTAWTRSCDRPYAESPVTSGAAAPLAALAVFMAVMFFARVM
ncbi:MAG: proton-conducting transporter membrane subunit [Hyphomonadaceae bacterium]